MSQVLLRETFTNLKKNIEEIVVIKESIILEFLLVALLCQGHILLDDIPGVGKTLLAKSFARSLDLDFNRIQFTPDLLPSDVTGLNYYNQKENAFVFLPGPVFCNILLADEVNRATPRTQASLLESMQEGTVTIDGKTRKLNHPFLVIATQNPIEMEGTFPLPEAQLDRFLFSLSLGYPSFKGEKEIVQRFLKGDPLEKSIPVTTTQELLSLEEVVSKVYFSPPVLNYCLEISRESRRLPGIRLGSSPRGTLYLARAVQALAAVRGRDYVLPDDVQDCAIPVLSHRILPDISSSIQEKTGKILVQQILEEVEVPLGPYTQEQKR